MADVLLKSDPDDWLFWCLGCECCHFFRVNGKGPRWELTGTLEKPTVTPSILVRGGDFDHPHARCHMHIRDGQIEYLGDCTHALAGQTVPMIPIP